MFALPMTPATTYPVLMLTRHRDAMLERVLAGDVHHPDSHPHHAAA
jgi:hypothetical protein